MPEKTINEKRLEYAVKREEEHQREFKKLEKMPIRKLLKELKAKGYSYQVVTHNYKTNITIRYGSEEYPNLSLFYVYRNHKHAMICVDIYTPFHMNVAVRIKGAKPCRKTRTC